MCGLYGWMKHPQANVPVEALAWLTRILTTANQQRGDDATGWAYGTLKQPPTVVKDVLSADRFLQVHGEALSKICAEQHYLMGHTRSKTTGENTVNNAHPFVMGDTVGAHNGVIRNHAALPINLTAYKLPGCDSAAFFAYADQVGFKKALAATDGSLALTAIQRPYARLTFYVDNTSRLATAYLAPWRCLVWSSDEDVLTAALAAVGERVTGKDDGRVVIWELKEETLYRIPLEDGLGEREPVWHATTAPTKPWEGSYGRWGDRQVAGYEPYVPATSTTPLRHGHRSEHNPDIWHTGKKKRCSVCRQRPQPPQHTLAVLPPALHPFVVYAKGQEVPRFVSIVPPQPHACLACYHTPLVNHPDLSAWECPTCGAWMEPRLPTTSEAPLNGGGAHADD